MTLTSTFTDNGNIYLTHVVVAGGKGGVVVMISSFFVVGVAVGAVAVDVGGANVATQVKEEVLTRAHEAAKARKAQQSLASLEEEEEDDEEEGTQSCQKEMPLICMLTCRVEKDVICRLMNYGDTDIAASRAVKLKLYTVDCVKRV